MGLLKLKLPLLRRKPAGAAGALASQIPTDRHQSVNDADPYSFQVAHRRLAWLLRISAGTNVALLFTIVVLGNAIATMLPLKTTEVALVRSYDANDKIYRIEPIAKNVYGFDVAMEGMAKRYVRECLEIDSVTQVERMRFCSRVAEAKYFERFTKERKADVEKDVKGGLTRSIMIETAERIEAVGNTYKYSVELLQVDKRNGVLVEQRKLRAYLNITTRPHRVHPVDKYENPHGFTVLEMSLKERANA